MNKKYTNNLEEITTYGFETIDPNETVEVNLKDLMYVFSTLQEYQRFFHQPMHIQSLEDVKEFMGTIKDKGGYNILHTSIHKKMVNMLPAHIDSKYDEGVFESPIMPFYYNESR